MDLHDYFNVRRILRLLAKERKCPVWVVRRSIQQIIDRNWEAALQNPEDKAVWDRYFPDGRPSTEQYILCLGHAHERGEDVPYFFKEQKN